MGLCSSEKSEKQQQIALTHKALSENQLPGKGPETPQGNTEYLYTKGDVLEIFEGKSGSQ